MTRPVNPHMARALELARSAIGSTSPNPPVGAVVVQDGEVVGEGSTRPAGQAHAEVVALRQAGELARGSTLYVTLEPCSHYGRTPPCAEAVIGAGISEIHVSLIDPNPIVMGRGLEQLRQAGIHVEVGEGREQAQDIIAPHTKFVTTGTPLVTAKFAMSLDGKIATRTGDSKWISSAESRRYAHRLRAQSDAIMVGIGTVLADDPRLTARGDEGGAPLPRQPLRVIVDSNGRLPLSSALLHQPGSTLVAVSDDAEETRARLKSCGADVVGAPSANGRVDLNTLMTELGRREITSVFVEGGGTLLGSLFDARLVDRVVGFIAPVVIGGESAPSPVAGAGIERMSDALRLANVRIEQFADDVAVIGDVVEGRRGT